MNILIFEYITGGGLVEQDLPSSLVNEGELMLTASANDFNEITDVQVSVLRDYRLQNTEYEFEQYIVSPEQNYSQIISKIEDSIDALLIIAPESNNTLTSLCEKYSEYDFILLNSSTQSVALTSNKLASYNYFKSFDIEQIPSYELKDIDFIQTDKIIVKPKDGVGCEGIHLFNSFDKTENIISSDEQEKYIAQPYLEGESLSLSLVCCQGECVLLSVNKQIIIEDNNSLGLKRCLVNAKDRDSFIEFSQNLVSKLSGLKGYIGIDVLIVENKTFLIEINPRLTTSYVGLKSALNINPAEHILHTFMHNELLSVNNPADNLVTVEMGKLYAA